MNMPKDYNNVTPYGDYTPLELGGHICKVMGVEEVKSSTGKDMLKISLDIAEGEQKDFYANNYKADTRDNKRWGCVVNQLVFDNDGNTHRGLKTFITAVENSNSGFKVVWGDNFAKSFKGKTIGGVFGREQYLNNDRELKWSTKCVQFRSVESIKKGVEVPKDKLLNGTKQKHQDPLNDVINSTNNYIDIGEDEKLPWEK
jgi:hypothetical protein